MRSLFYFLSIGIFFAPGLGQDDDCYIAADSCDMIFAQTILKDDSIVEQNFSEDDYENLDCACAEYCKVVGKDFWTNLTKTNNQGKKTSQCACGNKVGKVKDKNRWASGAVTAKAYRKLLQKAAKVLDNLSLAECNTQAPEEVVTSGSALVVGNTELVAEVDGWKVKCAEWGEDGWCLAPMTTVSSEQCDTYEHADKWHLLVHGNNSNMRNCPVFCWIATLGEEWHNDIGAEMEDCIKNFDYQSLGFTETPTLYRAYSWSGFEDCSSDGAGISHHGGGAQNRWDRYNTMRAGTEKYADYMGVQLRCDAWKSN